MLIDQFTDGQPGGPSPPVGASLADNITGEPELVTRSSSTAQSGAARSPPGVRDTFIIGRVRARARNVDASEYDPDHVSIGPYHYKQTHLRREDDKREIVATVLPLATAGMLSVEEEGACYLHELAFLEARARRFYTDAIDMTSEDFLRMLLLDGCYLLVCFRIDPVTSTTVPDELTAVRDLFYLAENQVPFFVLETIAGLTSNSESDGGDIQLSVNDIKWYAHALLRDRGYSKAVLAVPTAPGNLLHLLHMHLMPTELPPTSDGGENVTRWGTATDYNLAGVKFKSQAISEGGNVRCILDVKLGGGGGTLEIPCLDIDSQTWRLLRNLMALEQQNWRSTAMVGSNVTAYCFFMSQLACQARDVELLSRRGVIVHRHGNHGEVAKLFSDLCKGIEFELNEPKMNYLRTTLQEVEKRRRSRRRRWVALLRRNYFSNPWVMLGLMAAAIGLTCAVIQAVYSVFSYTK